MCMFDLLFYVKNQMAVFMPSPLVLVSADTPNLPQELEMAHGSRPYYYCVTHAIQPYQLNAITMGDLGRHRLRPLQEKDTPYLASPPRKDLVTQKIKLLIQP